MTLLRQIKEELATAPDFLLSDKLILHEWSAFTLAFYGFLRSSEFTSSLATQFNLQVHLCFTDVSFTSEGCLTLHLKSFKTDPYRQGCSLLIAPSHVLSVWCEPSGSTSLCVQSVVLPLSMSSSLGPTSPEPRLPQPFVLSSNISAFLLSSMHLTASGSAPLLPQPKLVCHLG